MKRRIFVIDNALCNGCRNCEMWCSFSKGNKGEFKTSLANVRIFRDPEGKINIPTVDCDTAGCIFSGSPVGPICVEMCPTGVLVYCDSETLKDKRSQYRKMQREQPIFRLIAPSKYPYPFRKWSSQEI